MPTQVKVGWRSGSSSQTATSIVTSGLVLNLDAGNVSSYSGTGTTWTDLSSTGNNGTLINGTGYSSQNGGVMTFDGVNDFVNCGNSSTFNQTNALTLSTWVKINSLSSENTLIGKQWCFLNQYSYFLYVDKQGKLVFDNANSGTCNGIFSTYTSTNSLSINTWYNVVLSFTNTSIKIYLNGQLISGSLSGINTGLFVGTAPVLLGTYRSLNGNYGLMLNGSMGSTLIYNTSLSASEITQNFDATKTRFGYSTLDTDVQVFITAASITDSTQQSAINTLVTQLKTYGIWTKLKAVYPFVGGNATSHKFNLKDPRDLDAAFRLQFNGGWTHNSNGVTPNGTNGYVDTYLTPNTSLSLLNQHISFYSRTNSTGGVDIAAGESAATIQIWGSTLYYDVSSGGYKTVSVSDSTGLIMAQRLNYVNNVFKNNSKIKTDNLGSYEGFLPSTTIELSRVRTGGYYSNKNLAFATIGNAMTDTEAANFYTAIQTFQSTLGRQIGVPIVADTDVQAFVTAASITDATQVSAVNTLVTSLKTAGVWTKMKAIYPFVGGTATSHKFNLKDPRDLDAAYRLVFNGGSTHNSTGYVPNLNSYADTKLNPSAVLSIDSAHFSYYSRTNTLVDNYDMGVATTNTGTNLLFNAALRWGDGLTYYSMCFNPVEISKIQTSTNKNFIFNKLTTSSSLFENTTKTTTSVTNRSGLPNANFFIAARNLNGTVQQSSQRNCAFASIGDGLTDAEATAFYNAVQAFQTTLGRQV